jgi:predicted PurR-regulated permease PerM
LLVSGLTGALLYFAHGAFIPVALAVLFALLLSSPVEALHRKGFPRSVSALLILAIFLGLVGGTVNLLWEPAQEWLAAAPRTSVTIQRKLGPVARVMHRIDVVTSRAGHLTDAGAGAAPAPSKVAVAPSDSDGLLARTRITLVAAMTVVILTLLLLAAGPAVLARMSAAFVHDTRASHLLRVIEAVRGEVGRYYATIALINLGLGAATCAAMMALGMPNPLLWGVLAGVLKFHPVPGVRDDFGCAGCRGLSLLRWRWTCSGRHRYLPRSRDHPGAGCPTSFRGTATQIEPDHCLFGSVVWWLVLGDPRYRARNSQSGRAKGRR